MLMETSIIFIADDLSTLSAASIGMQYFIDPLKWQQPYIPILPEKMEDILLSPIPIITGILRSHLDKLGDTSPEILDHIDQYTMIVNVDSVNK
jgi:DENN (AEX-3) domain